jgi:predicted phosphoribosyltransferase
MFRDREDAGSQLAEALWGRVLHRPLVLAVPRGGVVVGAALARALGADLDVVLARKLRAPGQPELALGAVGESAVVYLDPKVHGAVAPDPAYLDRERRFQFAEIVRRGRLLRADCPPAPIRGRSVLVTDDGLATGSTMIAALHAVRVSKPHELIVAVPVAAPDRLPRVRHWCDEVVCLHAPETFRAIGLFYDDFTQVGDEQVVELLRSFAPAPQHCAG